MNAIALPGTLPTAWPSSRTWTAAPSVTSTTCWTTSLR
ncbi:DUF3309 family protein [Pseudomonas orientalis]